MGGAIQPISEAINRARIRGAHHTRLPPDSDNTVRSLLHTEQSLYKVDAGRNASSRPLELHNDFLELLMDPSFFYLDLDLLKEGSAESRLGNL